MNLSDRKMDDRELHQHLEEIKLLIQSLTETIAEIQSQPKQKQRKPRVPKPKAQLENTQEVEEDERDLDYDPGLSFPLK